MSNEDALDALRGLKGHKHVGESLEPPGTAELWYRLASRLTASPKVWMDAYLAAFAIRGNLQLVTFDLDFQKFERDHLQLQLLPSPSAA